MNFKFSQLLEITLVAVLLFLVLNNWYGFTAILKAGGETYTSGVKALQGR
jgi:hypothetical protein